VIDDVIEDLTNKRRTKKEIDRLCSGIISVEEISSDN